MVLHFICRRLNVLLVAANEQRLAFVAEFVKRQPMTVAE